jgi:guanine deaminase
MDREAPESCLDRTPAESLHNSRYVISYINSLKSGLLRPILTPRFAISCTAELLSGLGDLAAETPSAVSYNSSCHPPTPHSSRLPIQTHISENPSEVTLTKKLFPSHSSYAAVYDDFGLLGPTTILAHGCHLTPKEITLIKKSGAGISHCPTSNFYLSSGVARVGEWIDEGVKVPSFAHLTLVWDSFRLFLS